MRIICPNCAAQYEVDAALIPQEGRDVQCSACGHTWMQYADGAVEEISDVSDPVPGTAAPEPAPPAAPPEAEPEPLPVDEPVADTAPTEAEADTAEDETPSARGQRRELDADARRILREEAQREAARRRARRVTGIETQPDLGLDDQPQKRAVPEPEAEPDPDPEPEAAPVEDTGRVVRPKRPERGPFPDIEELNSTLTAGESEESDRDESGRSEGSSFRTGFLLMLSLAILIMALYLAAPQIAERVPALQPELAAYVGAVNEFRAAVEGLFQNAAHWIEGLSA